MGFASAGSGKERLAVVSWNVELSNQTNAYGAVVVFRGKKNEQTVQALRFKRSTTLRPTLDEKSRYTAKEWPGAVYYEVLLQHQGNRPVYTLLGWDGADNIRTRKVIETLSVNGTKLKFGVPIISAGRGSTKRYIMEYSDQVSASLQWREDLDMIVMDHLSPPSPDLEGQTAYYGPDMSYDGFVWKKNHWVWKRMLTFVTPTCRLRGTTPSACGGGTGIDPNKAACIVSSVDETHRDFPLVCWNFDGPSLFGCNRTSQCAGHIGRDPHSIRYHGCAVDRSGGYRRGGLCSPRPNGHPSRALA